MLDLGYSICVCIFFYIESLSILVFKDQNSSHNYRHVFRHWYFYVISTERPSICAHVYNETIILF